MGKSKPAPPACGGATAPAAPPPDGTAPEGSAAGSAGGTGTGAAGVVEPCPPVTREVDNRVTETISNGDERWNGTYSWRSKYTLVADKQNCTVKVTMKLKVTGTVTAEQKAAWKSAIESKWNGKAYLCCTGCNCPRGLPITVTVEYVDSGEHYPITAQTPGATEGGRAGLGGTTSMTGWGVDDTVDITHEFGHMLGCPEEYYTTDGIDYTEGGTKLPVRDPSGGIMNNPANNPLPRNYEGIKSEAEAAMGGASCAARGVAT
ncbi:MAG: hypothetical protein IT162_10200 [Bryobacterales bacterium]|nr:hypothetical protein [Bryobacterales bacterium]